MKTINEDEFGFDPDAAYREYRYSYRALMGDVVSALYNSMRFGARRG